MVRLSCPRGLAVMYSWLTVALTLALTVSAAAAADGIRSIGHCTTIDKSGSYQLSKSLEAQGTCLLVTADFVTIDLAGYTITGQGTGFGVSNFTGTFPIIPLTNATEGLTLRNGSITHFSSGVALGGRRHVIEAVRTTDNTENGLVYFAPAFAFVSDLAIRNSVASANGMNGIVIRDLSSGNSIIGNSANSNGQRGIETGCPSTIVNNVASGNGGTAIFADLGCTRLGNAPAP